MSIFKKEMESQPQRNLPVGRPRREPGGRTKNGQPVEKLRVGRDDFYSGDRVLFGDQRHGKVIYNGPFDYYIRVRTEDDSMKNLYSTTEVVRYKKGPYTP